VSDQARCDRCKHFRPIAAFYAKGDRIGECRQGPAAFRGMAHQGEGYLGVWGHTRAHWECGSFQAAEGTQPFAERDQPENDPDARDFGPATPATDAPAGSGPVDQVVAQDDAGGDTGTPKAGDEPAQAAAAPGAETAPTEPSTPPAGAGVTALPETGNTPPPAKTRPIVKGSSRK
jgi:hypothetical protein